MQTDSLTTATTNTLAAVTKTLAPAIDPISALKKGIVTIDHLNIGLIFFGLIMFVIILTFFFIHSRRFLQMFSGSLKDPVTGQWSPKICTGFMIASCVLLIHLTWLKSALATNDFSLAQMFITADYLMLGGIFGIKMAEKMQAKKIDGKEDPNTTTTTTTTDTNTTTETKV